MLKKKLDEQLRKGILTQEEYASFFQTMRVNERGEMIGFTPHGNARLKHDFDGDLINGDPLQFLLKHCCPPLGVEDMDNTFKKYGTTIAGIGDDFHWFTKDNITKHAIDSGHRPVEEASELEIWRMIAVCSRYWETAYHEWFEMGQRELAAYTKQYGWDVFRSVKHE